MPSVDGTLTLPNHQHLLTLLTKHHIRPSLRKLGETRPLNIEISPKTFGSCTVSLGNTRISCKISAEIVPPFEERPFEGIFNINTEISPMCSPIFSNGNLNDDNQQQQLDEVTISRIIEKSIRRANALDLESLCIHAGSKCWSVRADVHFLNYDGNLIDTACIAVLTSLLHFKKQDLEVVNGKVILYDEMQRELVPLSILHIPLCVTFSFFSAMDGEWRVKGGDPIIKSYADSKDEPNDDDMNGDDNNNNTETGESKETVSAKSRTEILKDVIVVDADSEEEPLALGTMTLTLNSNRELCQVSKSGGLTIDARGILECTELASGIVNEWTKKIKNSIKLDFESRRDLRAERVLKVVNDRQS